MKKYFTEEERKAANVERVRRWRKKHPGQRKEESKRYRDKNPDKIKKALKKWKEEHPDYQNEYRNTPIGRACYLVDNYKQNDKKYNRGECTLTPEWIVENIFSKPCHYCGETDWLKMGCDRIDNSKPHTPDNVVPCCDKCNRKRGTMSYDEFIKKLGESPLP